MAGQLVGRRVAFLATDGVEQVEFTAPWNALKQAGAEVKLDGEEYLVIRESDLLAIVTNGKK